MTHFERVQNALRRRARKAIGSIGNVLEKPLYAHNILSARRNPLPDFFCIGAMKGGTTWLYENLRHHPQIYLPDRKEDYFFSYDFYRRSLRQYSRRFAQGEGQVKGEITPGYGILTVERIKFIHSIMPDAKLILLLRDPVYRTWSEACMNLAKKKQRKLEEVTKQEFLNYFDSGPCQQRSNYLAILDNWLSAFPPESLFLGLYEDIESSSTELFKDILRHLEVSADISTSSFPLKTVIIPEYERYGGVHRGSLNDEHIRSDNFLPDEFRTLLAHRYRNQAQALHERFGIPIGRWKSGVAGTKCVI